MEMEDFEKLVEICYFHGAVELQTKLKTMLKDLANNQTVRSCRKMQLLMQQQLNPDPLFYKKKWISSTVDNWLDYIEISSKNPLIKINSEGHKSASIYYSLIDRISFHLNKVFLIGNVEIAKKSIIQDIDKYDLDTNKSLRENIYEIYYTYDNLPTSKKAKNFEMDFIAFVISDNHIDTYVTRLVDHQLYVSTKLRMHQTVEIMRKAKMDDSDPLNDSPRFRYFCDPRILPSTISEPITEKSSGRKNTKKTTNGTSSAKVNMRRLNDQNFYKRTPSFIDSDSFEIDSPDILTPVSDKDIDAIASSLRETSSLTLSSKLEIWVNGIGVVKICASVSGKVFSASSPQFRVNRNCEIINDGFCI
ncbi:hypothetical protein Glove_132g25 [Diversispora epigaea]|uniref:Uncharacterized protein n=1 Tax=Diversispora epigaea TaxID=1348612 RepID=A0A397IXT5_9GLOM|nr:hypothetical protein Glove_132g25 [Diversispora epigaea]